MRSPNQKFVRAVGITLFFIVFVVFAGSTVKVTGSGMGCPDWPKCFGYYIPPMSEDQVIWKPDHNYETGQMIIHNGTLLKAENSFTSGENFSSENWAKYDKHEYAIYKPIHTIIEYVNRLASVLLGFVALYLVWKAFRTKNNKGLNIFLAFVTLFLIGFEAWLGRLVVEGVLNPTDISYHMLAAFVIIIVLSYAFAKNHDGERFEMPKAFRNIQIFAFLYLILQLSLGVVVRQTFDTFADDIRADWVELAGIKFLVHRSSSLIYLAAIIVSYTFLKNVPRDNFLWKNFKWLMILTGMEIVTGAAMGYLDVPKIMQPVHVITSSALLVAQANLFFWSVRKYDTEHKRS